MGLKENLSRIRHSLGASPVTLVAVTKHATLAQMIEAYELGVRHFGENKVQDALDKKAQLPVEVTKSVTWHLIGHLQSNKINKMMGEFDLIHSIDSLALAQGLSEKNSQLDRVQPVLLQVNVSGEPTKFGFRTPEMKSIVNHLKDFSGIKLCGLMTMAPAGVEETVVKAVFTGLRVLRDELEQACSMPLAELSMGMSQDYVHALDCGATIIRIGSDLFHGN